MVVNLYDFGDIALDILSLLEIHWFLCVLPGLPKNYRTNFTETWLKGGEWSKEEPFQFWLWLKAGFRISFSLSLTFRDLAFIIIFVIFQKTRSPPRPNSPLNLTKLHQIGHTNRKSSLKYAFFESIHEFFTFNLICCSNYIFENWPDQIPTIFPLRKHRQRFFRCSH